MTSTDQVRDEFVERLFASALGTMDVFTVYLGDRLGLYCMLAEQGPLTAGELAERAGMYARYAREWLEQQAAAGILQVDDAAKPEEERRFSLPAGHAEALIDPENPYAMAALCRSLAALGGVLPKLVDTYRTGEGLAVEGPYLGAHFRGWTIPAPAKFAVEHVHIYRVAAGRLAEHWVVPTSAWPDRPKASDTGANAASERELSACRVLGRRPGVRRGHTKLCALERWGPNNLDASVLLGALRECGKIHDARRSLEGSLAPR